jgi:hypothetical protein
MDDIKLITEQIKLEYPASIIDSYSNNKTIIYITLEPFGKLSMDNEFKIEATYSNPFKIKFDFYKNYFEPRLKFDNATTYIYEDRIIINKRVGNDYSRTPFENSIVRANNFITVAKEIENFITYNTSNPLKEK